MCSSSHHRGTSSPTHRNDAPTPTPNTPISLTYYALKREEPDHPGSSNGPTEAINGRPEHLRGIALGFRNLTSYTIRSLIHTGRLKDHLTATT